MDKLREDESEICYRVRNIGSQVGVLDLSNLGMSEVPTELIMKLIRRLLLLLFVLLLFVLML